MSDKPPTVGHIGQADIAEAPVRAGDTIRPKNIPGETWLVAGVYGGGTVMNAGWPRSLLYSDEYSIDRRCSDQEHEEMLRRCAEISGDDPRRSLAIEVLQKMGKLPPTPPTELDAANAQIKELKENLAEMTAARDEYLTTANIRGTLIHTNRDALKASLDNCEKLEKELEQTQRAAQRSEELLTDENATLREQAGKLRAAMQKLVEWDKLYPKNAVHTFEAEKKFDECIDAIKAAALNSPSPSPCPTCEKMSAALIALRSIVRDTFIPAMHSSDARASFVNILRFRSVMLQVESALSTISLTSGKRSSSPSTPENPPAECAKCEDAKQVITSLYCAADKVIEKATLGTGGVFLIHEDIFNALHDAVIQTPTQDYGIADDNAGNPVDSPPPASPSSADAPNGFSGGAKCGRVEALLFAAQQFDTAAEVCKEMNLASDMLSNQMAASCCRKWASEFASAPDAPREVENGGGL